MSERPLMVFDSGIGGLTVLRELRVLIPDRHIVYIADDAGFPYGDWEKNALTDRIVGLLEGLIDEHDPVMIVIACNTASTLVLDRLRKAIPKVPIVGTVPAIKPAAERTRSGLVSVLATPGTVRRAYTQDLINSFGSRCHVHLVGSERLAKMAEDHVRGIRLDDQALLKEIGPCFIEKDGKKTDIVVLACTHYPFLANEFRRLAPWPVDWLDPAEAIARRARSLIDDQMTKGEPGYGSDIAMFTAGDPGFATRRLIGGFGLKLQAAIR